MSIGSSPFQGGGSASIADATESTAGKIRIATTSESDTGTNDTTAMTPAKVKARIDAALVGGVEYKGSYTGQSLVTAEQGDLYVSAATYSLAGVQVLSGDHIIFNQDAADPVTSTMFDKIDNTDQVSSVNTATGAVVLNGANLDGEHSSPSNYSATTDKIEKHLEGIDTALGARQPLDAQLTDVAGLTPTNNHVIVGDNSNFTAAQLASTQLSDSTDLARLASPALTGTPTAPTQSAGDNSTNIATTAYVDSAVTSAGGNQITDIEIKTGSTFTAEANHLYICGYTSGTQTITFPDASSSTTGDIIGLSTQSATRAVSLVSSDGTTNDLLNNSNQTKGGTNGALSLNIHRQISWFVSDGALWLEANAALSTVATTGAYSDLSGSPSLATVATTGAYSDLSGTPTVPSALTDLSDVTIGTAASGEVLRYSGSAWVDAQLAYSDLSGTPSLATVATTGAYSDLSGTPTVPSALTDLSDVTIGTAASGEYLRYSGSAWVDDSLSIIDDTTPQLGGDLDVNGQDISTTSGNAKIGLKPHGTGFTELIGNTTGGNNPGAIRFNCEQNTHGAIIKSPLHSDYASGGDYTLTLPTGLPASDKILQSSSAGVLSWVDQASGGGTIPDVVVTGNTGNVSAAFASAGSNGENERVYLINNSSTARTVTLPATSGNSGKKLQVKRLGTANVTIAVQSGETLETTTDGTFILSAQFSSVTLVCNASGTLDGWYII